MITIVKSGPGNKEQTSVKLCNQLPAQALLTFPCNSRISRKWG